MTGDERKVASAFACLVQRCRIGDPRAEEYGPASRSWYAPGGGAQQQANARWEHNNNEGNGMGWNQGRLICLLFVARWWVFVLLGWAKYDSVGLDEKT